MQPINRFFIVILCSLFFIPSKSQTLEKISDIDYSSANVSLSGSTEEGDFIGYISASSEIVHVDSKGKITRSKVSLPKGGNWFLHKMGNAFYFRNEVFEKEKFTVTMAPFESASNTVGTPKIMLQVESKSDPRWYRFFQVTSQNEKFFGEVIYPVKDVTSAAVGYSASADNFVVVIYNKDLEIIYNKRVPFSMDHKDFDYNTHCILGDDGTLYSFGNYNNKKGSATEKTYALITITPDGQISEPRKSDWNIDEVSSMATIVTDKKIIHFGLWGDKGKKTEGTFYAELDPENLKVITEQKTTLSIEDQKKFTNIPFINNQIAKGKGFDGMYEIDSHLLSDGTIAAVYRRTGPVEANSPEYEYASVMVSFLGPQVADNKNTILLFNQHSPGKYNMFMVSSVMINDRVIVFLNDHISNKSITTEGNPVKYDPYMGKSENSGVYALIVSPDGNVKRQELGTLSGTPKLAFNSAIYQKSADRIILYGSSNPDTKIMYQDPDKLDTQPKIVTYKMND